MQISSAQQPRFHVFLIDLGWKTETSRVIYDNLGVIHACVPKFFVLDHEQSWAVMRRDPHLIGSDPCLIVHDLYATSRNGLDGYHGFRLSLGRAKDSKEALRLFQDFMRFAVEHFNSSDIQRDLRKKLHREGWAQTIELLHHAI